MPKVPEAFLVHVREQSRYALTRAGIVGNDIARNHYELLIALIDEVIELRAHKDDIGKSCTGRLIPQPRLHNIPTKTELGYRLRKAIFPEDTLPIVDYAEIERHILHTLELSEEDIQEEIKEVIRRREALKKGWEGDKK